MMDFPLTVSTILRRAETLYAHKAFIVRKPDRSIYRTNYGDIVRRAKQLAVALAGLGLEPGDRVATLAWNHERHMEAYLGVPIGGFVLHTLNLRLANEDLVYIVNHADDRVLLVDQSLLPLAERIRPNSNIQHVIVMTEDGIVPPGMLDYEEFIAGADAADFSDNVADENTAAAMCYTSGTTGRPKGVVYSHRSIVLHSMASVMHDLLATGERDRGLVIVPMFHAMAWGIPYSAPLAGSTLIMPGPYLDAESLLDLLSTEHATYGAGVPTIWMGLLAALDKEPARWDLSHLRMLLSGGQAAPLSMLRGFKERHNIQVVNAWGMTETSPLGSIANLTSDLVDLPQDEQYSYLTSAGQPAPFVEIRARNDDGLIAWDGEAFGELEVRGPWVAGGYHDNPDAARSFTDDGWFKTGDIVSIDPRGYIRITDRAKDVVKSGGEWISSVALENALMGHPAVAEAAAFAVAHEKWLERPMSVVVLKDGQTATPAELREFLATQFPSWWLPDRIEFVSEIPKTSVGKFQKSALRDQYWEALLQAD